MHEFLVQLIGICATAQLLALGTPESQTNCSLPDFLNCPTSDGNFTCLNVSACLDRMNAMEQQCAASGLSFCPKQGTCYDSSRVYMPWSTCDYGSNSCPYSYYNPRYNCYQGFNLCLDQRQCDEATAKRMCPNNATLVTSLSSSNSCYVPANVSVRLTVLEQEGSPVLRFGAIRFDKSRLSQELLVNKATDNSSCVSVDPLAMLNYTEVTANVSWARLRMRYVDDRDGRVVAECQPSYGILLPGKVKPVAAFPTVVVRRSSTGSIYEYFYLFDVVRGNITNATSPTAAWCNTLGVPQFPDVGPNVVMRQLCREMPSRGAYCYIDAPALYTDYNFYVYNYGRGPAAWPFGTGYLIMSLENVYTNVYLRQPGSANLVCKAWNGLLPQADARPTDTGYFGDDLLRIEYTVNCSYGYEACLATRGCVPIGTSCRQSINCSSQEMDCPAAGACLNVSACLDRMNAMEQQCAASGLVSKDAMAPPWL